MVISRFTYLVALVSVLITGGMAPQALSQSQEFDIRVSLDRDTIGLDEQATMMVVVTGPLQNLPEPQMPTLPMFEVYSQGRSSNLSIVNGVVSSSVSYRYILLPKKAGTFPIDQISFVHQNKRYKGNRVELTVLNRGTSASDQLEQKAQGESGGGRDYFFEAVVDNERPFVNEQVTLTLKFFIAVQYYGSPELTEPTTTGFWSELLGNKAPYYQKIGDKTYRVIERKYALFPTQTGELSVGRAMITVTVASRDRRDPFDAFGTFFGRGEDVRIRSNPVTINVRSLPQQGKPDNFTGTIGRFNISASVDKTEVEVNQPVTARIQISGTGNIKSVAEPIIPELDEFRIYRASSNENLTKTNDRIGGAKVYEEVFIPRRPGRLIIPALSFNYFDPSSERYRSVSTQPITLNVMKPEGYVASPDIPYGSPDFAIGSAAKDIRYIKQEMGNPSRSTEIILTSPLYLVVNGLPVLAFFGLVIMRWRREKFASDIGLARSRTASRAARKRLAKAKSVAHPDSAGEFYAEVHTAVTSYIADKLNISPYGLTSEKISGLMQEHGADSAVVQRTLDLLKECDFARFAPSNVKPGDIERTLQEAQDVMVAIEGVHLG